MSIYFIHIIIVCLYLLFIFIIMSDSQHQQPTLSGLRDYQRLNLVWKNLKQSKKGERISDKKSLHSVKDAIHMEQQKNLQARLTMTQNQLSKARQNTALLMKKLSQAEDQIENLKQQLENEKKQNEERDHHIAQLTSHFNSIGRQQKQHNTFGMQKQNNELQEQVQQLRQVIQNKNREFQRLNIKIRSIELDLQKQTNQIQKITDQNQMLKKQLGQAENTIHEIYLDQQSKGAQLLQIDQKNRTIQRLINLLKSTSQFKQFALFSEDTKGIHFLKNIPKRFKSESLLQLVPKKPKICSCMDLKIQQKLIWTPTQTYKFMLDMKIKYETLNEQCIQQILFGLNQIWLARQQNHVRRVRQNYQNQLAKMKKKCQERYDELLARKQIQRLKKQVNKAKYKTEKGYVKMENLKVAGQYQDQLRLKQKQIKLLHQRVKIIENESNNYDKVIYMQGALWIISKVVEQLQNNRQSLKQFEQHFTEKLENIITDEAKSQKIMKAYKFFFQSLQQLHESLYEKILLMQESTSKKLAEKKLKQTQKQNTINQTRITRPTISNKHYQ